MMIKNLSDVSFLLTLPHLRHNLYSICRRQGSFIFSIFKKSNELRKLQSLKKPRVCATIAKPDITVSIAVTYD